MEILGVKFTKKDGLGLLVLPGLMLAGLVIKNVFASGDNQVLQAAVTALSAALALTLLLFFQGEVLQTAWQTYRQKLWLKVLISIGGMMAMHLIIWACRFVLPRSGESIAVASEEVGQVLAPALALLVALPSLMAVFLEELTFRHLLFYKFKTSKLLFPLMLLVSSVLFGLAHWNNFQGNVLATIPYMFGGAFLALVYAKTKNICYPLGIHLVFNALNVLLGVAASIFIALVGTAAGG